jgi:hypothetical protein
MVQGQPGQKVIENPAPISTNKPGIAVSTCNSSYVGIRGRRIKVQDWPGQMWETLSEKQLNQKGLEA